MPIDITKESLISLTEATKHLPRRRRGKRPHVSTLHRWASRGCKGEYLEVVQVGGTRCTSIPALARFFDRLRNREHDAPESASPTHEEAVIEADRVLDSAGI